MTGGIINLEGGVGLADQSVHFIYVCLFNVWHSNSRQLAALHQQAGTEQKGAAQALDHDVDRPQSAVISLPGKL